MDSAVDAWLVVKPPIRSAREENVITAHFIVRLQMAEDFERCLRQRLHGRVYRLGHVEEQNYGQRQLITGEIGYGLRPVVFEKLKVLRRERIQRAPGLLFLHARVEQD